MSAAPPRLRALRPEGSEGQFVRLVSGLWAPADAALGDLSDVDLTTTPPTSGDSLTYDGSNWVPDTIGGGSAHVIQDEGTPLTARANLDFVGGGVTVTDDGVDTTTVTIPSVAGSAPQRFRRTAGNVTLNWTGWQVIDTGLDMAFAAQVGDWIEVGISGLLSVTNVSKFFDFWSIVSAAAVNPWGGSVSPNDFGPGGWQMQATTAAGSPVLTGSVVKQVVSGDISSGTVTLRLMSKASVATSRTLFATADNPLMVWGRNLSR